MLYILIGLSLLFVALGFMVTENNAPYLLAGYNTMSEEERARFDLKGFLAHFKRFQIFLGVSFLVFGLVLHYYISKNASGIFLSVYPILAYIYFFWRSKRFSTREINKPYWIVIIILIANLLLSAVILGSGYKENELLIHSGYIEFTGLYGEKVPAADIKSIQLQSQIPPISSRINGYAFGDIRKGYFSTQEGKQVKLFLNSDKKPYLLFTRKDKIPIYYAPKSQSPTHLFAFLEKTFPNRILKYNP